MPGFGFGFGFGNNLHTQGAEVNVLTDVKKNFHIGEVSQLLNLDSTIGWTAVNSTISIDTDHKIEGTGSLKIQSTGATSGTANKTINANLSAIYTFRISVYVESLLGLNDCAIYLSQNNFTAFASALIKPLKVGWNTFIISRADFSITGAVNWNNPFDIIRLRVNHTAENKPPISFDNIEIITALPRAGVCVMFDDGYLDNYTVAFPILKARNIPATLYVVTGNVGTAPCVTKAMLTEMQSKGWCIGNHTHTHQHFSTLTPEQIATELNTARTWLNDNGFNGGNHVAYPFSDVTEAAKQVLIDNNYLTARTVNTETNYIDDRINWIIYPSTNIGTPTITLQQAKDKILAAKNANKVISILFHKIKEDATGDDYAWNTAYFTALMDYIIGLGIQPITQIDAHNLRTQDIKVRVPRVI